MDHVFKKSVCARSSHHIGRWALDRVLAISVDFPVLLRVMLTGSHLRMQGIVFACAAIHRLGHHEVMTRLACTDDVGLASVLVHRRVRDLADAILVPAPEGFVTALGRLGSHPLLPDEYFKLAALLSAAEAPATALRAHQGQITADTIEAAELLNPMAAQCRKILELVRDRKAAETINILLEIIRASTDATDMEIIQSLEDSGPRDLGEWASEFLRRRMVRVPALPVADGHPSLRTIQTAVELSRIARDWKNCLVSRITTASLGVTAYVINQNNSVIAEVRRLTGSNGTVAWMVSEIAEPRDRTNSKGEMAEFVRDMKDAGILTDFHSAKTAKNLRALGEWMNFTFDPPDLDTEELAETA